MKTEENLHPQYVMDASGEPTAVLLPIDEYRELLEDLQDLATTAERVDESIVPHAQAVAELKEDGYLRD